MNRQVISALVVAMLMIGTVQAQQSSNWQFHKTKNSMTDEPHYIAQTLINDHKALAVGCLADAVTIVVMLGPVDVAFGEFRQVAWRVDDQNAVYQQWDNLRKGGASLYGEPALDLAREIRDAKQRILIRSNGNTEEFSVKGSTVAIGKVLDNCPG